MAKNISEKCAYLNRLSTEQLEELLRADFESEENVDVDVIFHVLEVIERREKEHPTGRLPDTNVAWEEFQQHYNIPEGEGLQLYPYGQTIGNREKDTLLTISAPDVSTSHRTHRGLWNVFVASVAVIIFFSGMVIAQAAGIDVFGAIGQWTEETFHFISGSENRRNTSQDDLEKNVSQNRQFYNIMQETLDSYGIDAELAPLWYPSGFTISGPEFLSNDSNEIIYFSFSDGKERFFSIDFTYYRTESDINNYIYEKDDTTVEQYISNSKMFYILSNNDTLTATWAYGNLVETITGNLQVEELKAIIDSIGE